MLHLPDEIQDHIWEDVHILNVHDRCLHELKHVLQCLFAQGQNVTNNFNDVCMKESCYMEVLEMCMCFVFGFVSAVLLIEVEF